MQPESQLQGIQCGGNSFFLNIFGFPYFLYVYGACPYHQNFLEGYFDHYDLYLICVQFVRGDIPPRTTFPSGSCSLSPKFEPFITICLPSNYSRSRLRIKAQYMIWALNPTITICYQLEIFLSLTLQTYYFFLEKKYKIQKLLSLNHEIYMCFIS